MIKQKLFLFLIFSFLMTVSVQGVCYFTDDFLYTNETNMRDIGGWNMGDFGGKNVVRDGYFIMNESFDNSVIDIDHDITNINCDIADLNLTYEFRIRLDSYRSQVHVFRPQGMIFYNNGAGNSYHPFTALNATYPSYTTALTDVLGAGAIYKTIVNNTWYIVEYKIYQLDNGSCATDLVIDDVFIDTVTLSDSTVIFDDVGFSSAGAGASDGQFYVDYISVYDTNEIAECISRTPASCEFPRLFCDDFDYSTPIRDRWTVLNTDNSYNTSITPTDNEFIWNNINPKSIGYPSIDPYDYYFPLNNQFYVESTRLAPAMSIEYDITFQANETFTDDLEMIAFDKNGRSCLNVQFENLSGAVNMTYVNGSDFLGAGSFTQGTEHKIKISYFFGNANTEQKAYPFNTSVEYNQFDMYIDNVLVREDFFNDNCINIDAVFLNKYFSTGITIDNYYHYVGTDKNVDTLPNYFYPIYDNTTETTDVNEETDDLAEVIDDFWETFGLRTVRSKFMFGLMMLFLLAVFTTGAMISYGQFSASGLAVICFVGLIVLYFMGLIPGWVTFAICFLAGGMAFWIAKHSTG